ncbi:hypothetical protein BD779DRAFT_1670173 [Infundibulicybe gibba]|nr:hypothetical protein BD779DRAFT_1670173 [Infundibulicybe gibba]
MPISFLVQTNDTFDPGAAQLAASQTPSASQSSSSFTQTSLSATPTNAGDTVTSSSKSNAGPIAGGVVGGIIVIAAVGLAVLWYYKRSQRVAYPSANLDGGGVPVAAPQMDEHMDDTRHLASPSSLTPSRPIYDSSDTTSFNPGSPVTSGVYTTFGYRASMEIPSPPPSFLLPLQVPAENVDEPKGIRINRIHQDPSNGSILLHNCVAVIYIVQAFNSLNQSPCVIAEFLGGVCNSGVFTIPALGPTDVYLGPTKETSTACRCSSVFYSVVSACAFCQLNDFLKWSVYSTNCTSPSVQTFPPGIPPGTAVPHYAFENVLINDMFDPTTAEADIGDPESTAPPKPTSGGSSSSPPPSPGKKSNAGAIAGGVVGGVVFLVAVAALAFWWTRRRRQAPPTSNSALPPAGHTTPMSYNYTASTLPQSPRVYDPSDPSTFPPTNPSSGTVYTAQHTGTPLLSHTGETSVYPAMTGTTQSSGGMSHYTGRPEV